MLFNYNRSENDMEKQYTIAFTNTNPRLDHTTRYFKNVIQRYPFKTQELREAQKFSTKAEVRSALRRISNDNLYYFDIEIIPA